MKEILKLENLYPYKFPEFTRDLPTHIFDNVFISGVNFSSNLPEWCEKNNFSAIISFTKGQKHYDVKSVSIPIKVYDINDREGENIIPHLEDAYKFYKNFGNNNFGNLKDNNVLVHCSWGMSRSASCIIFFLMKEYNLDFNKAFMIIKNKRNIIQPNHSFMKQLYKYK